MGKAYGQQVFSKQLGNDISVVCRTEDTRTGFRHIAELFINGQFRGSAKCTYCNRTWERFRYESVLLEAIEKFAPERERLALKDRISKL